ncbi:MAG: SDR family oxidoreductase [Desulfobacteraceae bacterium]|nr:MAG: SDR family oxidoreductase [Desulfobacteraceae bacterium]
MKILIIGASRGIGFSLFNQALSAAHEVTAMARDPSRLGVLNKQARVLKGDILDMNDLKEAVHGQEGVCITIGVKPAFKPVTVFSEGTRNVVNVMKNSNVKKLICVTGIGAGDSKGHGGFLYDRIFNPLLLKTIYQDKDRQEEIVRTSDLDWEILRPGFLTNGSRTGRYRVVTDLTGFTAGKISREDTADYILKEFAEMRYVRKSVLLNY